MERRVLLGDRSIYLEEELKGLAADAAGAGLLSGEVDRVEPCRGTAGFAGEMMAEDGSGVVRLLGEAEEYAEFVLVGGGGELGL